MKNKEKSEFIDPGCGVERSDSDSGSFPNLFKVEDSSKPEENQEDAEDSQEADDSPQVVIVQDINDKFIYNSTG